MSAPYRLDLDVGPMSWSIESDAPADLPEVLAGFRIGWSTPDTDLWPTQPDPDVCVFSLLGSSAAQFSNIDLGSAVHAEFTAGAPVGPNLWPESTFETAEDWTANAGSNEPTTSTTHAHSGARALRLVRGAGTSTLYGQRTLVAALLPEAGDYLLTTWVWIPAGASGDQGLRLAGAGLPATIDVRTSVRSSWVQLSVPFTYLGSGAVTLSAYGQNADASAWWDDIELHQVGATAAFHGTVGALQGRPRRFMHPQTGNMTDGWQLDVQAVDYVAQLAEWNAAGERLTTGATTGDGIYPHELVLDLLYRVNGYIYEAPGGSGASEWWGDAGFDRGAQVILTDEVESGTVADEIEKILRTVADDTYMAEQGLRRGVIRANLDPDTHEPVDWLPYMVEWLSLRNPSTPALSSLPARFALLSSGLYGPLVDPDPDLVDGSLVLSANYLTRDVAWTRTKYSEPDRVVVANPTPPELRLGVAPFPAENWAQVTTTRAGAGAQATAAHIDAPLFFRDDAELLGELYLDDDSTPDTAWHPAGFTWWASEDPSWPQRLSWFHRAPDWRGIAVPVAIADVPDSQAPNGRPLQVGLPDAVDLVVEAGRFRFDFTLRPRIPRPFSNGSALSFADLAADFPTVTHDQLDPDYTSTDYRLVRKSDNPH